MLITRRDFTGLAASALWGGATDGGFDQRQYSLVGGQAWRDGGAVMAVSYAGNSRVAAGQRSFTRTMNPQTDLYPDLERVNGFVSVHQRTGQGLRLGVDGLYSHSQRDSRLAFGSGPMTASGSRNRPSTSAYLVAPNLELDLANDWTLSAYATLGRDRTNGHTDSYAVGTVTSTVTNCYCSRALAWRPVSRVRSCACPAARSRLAAGIGYRASRSLFAQFTNGVAGPTYAEEDSVGYAFGELEAPLARRLTATAALRYEDYNSFGSVTTPKLGLIFSATPQLRFSAPREGKSFKAPQFYQRYQRVQVLLLPATGYGTTFPPDAAYIFRTGGNPDLAPEKPTARPCRPNIVLLRRWRLSCRPATTAFALSIGW
ncbi:TonB-dependent receptor domain-containing protein [Caulobacter segnis]